jgi:RNA polymerase sigma factor (sigma-70 family)
MKEERVAAAENLASYRDLSRKELSTLWERGGDVHARDILFLRRWREGDHDAGMELLDLYKKFFYGICRRRGVNRDDEILEVYQEVILDLMERLQELPDRIEKSFSGYFGWRTWSAIQRMRVKNAPVSLDLVGPQGYEHKNRLELWEVIERCWEKLPPGEYKVFELRYIREMDLKEIANRLGSNVNAVGQSIFRLSRKMRSCLKRIAG